MKIKFSWISKILLLAVVFLTACDDGELRVRKQNFSITPASPVIVKFDADPNQILAGESSTITWEVSGADAIEITSVGKDGSSPIHVETKEAAGTVVAKNLTADTDFIITATVAAGAEAEDDVVPKGISISAYPPKGEDVAIGGKVEDPSGSSTALPSTKTITVKVVSAEEVSAMITADKGTLAEGESTIIRWSVTPEDATVEVVDDQGVAAAPTYAGDDCLISDPDELLDRGTPTDQVPAKGCAVVSPLQSSVYTVTGTSKSGTIGSADVAVSVANVEIFAEIKVNGVKNAKVFSFSDPLDITWKAEPAGSIVTIKANPTAVSCTPELPAGQAVNYSSASCVVSGATEFIIEVETPSAGKASDTANVALGETNVGLDIRSDEWAFPGEEVSLEIKAASGTDASQIKEVQISDLSAAGFIKRIQLPTAGLVKVITPPEGIRVKMVDTSDHVTDYGVMVRSVATFIENVTENADAITTLSFDPNNKSTRFAGVQMSGWNHGKLRIYKNGADIDIDLGTALKSSNSIGNGWVESFLNDVIHYFPVNAISVRPGNSNEIYVATTGGVMVSDDAGKNFGMLVPARFISSNGKDYDGSHPTCRGLELTGVEASHPKQITNLKQVCDLEVSNSGRLIVATDMGILTIKNVQALRDKKAEAGVVGRPAKGETAESSGYLTFGHVVDDVICADSDSCSKAFAAADNGVFVSNDGGEIWAAFGTLSARAYELKILGDTIYAATESGVYQSPIASAEWSRMGVDSKVLSLAIDPTVGKFGRMLIAATEDGMVVTRDSGATWSAMNVDGISAGDSVALWANTSQFGGKMINVMFGSGKNIVFGQALVGTVAQELENSEYEEALLSAGADAKIVEALKARSSK